MNKKFLLTVEGIEDLKAELQKLVESRAPLAERIKIAREMGDLSENAEYQTAREDHTRLEARIHEVEHILRNSKEITKSKSDVIGLGSNVVLSNNMEKKKFQVVGTVQADPMNGKVSDESPIGIALIGKKLGETVEIKTPNDTLVFVVSSID
ncbi:transcription elongation factor GreA [Candidatus Saccharibacteria bacterium]|jgi:transcription elongation factor GreA|nr:transcription elongation factor GreA [Candidatus Saccharibacteria bacterium]